MVDPTKTHSAKPVENAPPPKKRPRKRSSELQIMARLEGIMEDAELDTKTQRRIVDWFLDRFWLGPCVPAAAPLDGSIDLARAAQQDIP